MTDSTTTIIDESTTIRLALTARDTAVALGISPRKLWELTNRHLVPHVRLGRKVVYPIQQLQEWLAEQAGQGR